MKSSYNPYSTWCRLLLQIFAEYTISIFMKTVVAHFVGYVKHYHHTNCQPNRQSTDINQAEQLLLYDVTPGYFKIIPDHFALLQKNELIIKPLSYTIKHHIKAQLSYAPLLVRRGMGDIKLTINLLNH